MKYYLQLLRNEIRKTIHLSIRYKFNTIFSTVFWSVLMFAISYTIAQKNPGNVYIFTSSFMIWLIVNNTFIAIVDSIMSESTQGTLEQLYVNSRSFYGMLLVKGISSALLSIIQTLLSIVLGIILIPQLKISFLLQWISVLPLIIVSLFSLIGVGIACASLSLKYKNISSFYSLVSSIFFGVVTYGAKSLDKNILASLLIPFGNANSALQQFFQSNTFITVKTYGFSLINGIFYMIIGYVCLWYYEEKSKGKGLFSKF